MRAEELSFAADVATRLTDFRERDLLRAFRAHDKQRLFLQSEKREVYLITSNRFGKTLVLAVRVACLARFGVGNPADIPNAPPFQAKKLWVISLSNAMSEAIMQPLLCGGEESLIPAAEIATIQRKPEAVLTLKNGSVIFFKTCEAGREKFQGAEIDEADFDEAPPYPIYREVAIRFGAKRQCKIRMACTLLPPSGQTGGVVQWLWSEKIEPWLAGKSRDQAELIGGSMRENPHIPRELIKEAERIYPPGSLDRRIRIDGEWLPGLLGARVYAPFERRLHGNQHIGPHTVDPLAPLFLAVDVNVNPLCATIVQKQGAVYRALDEIVLTPGTLERLGQEVCRRYGGHRNELIVYGDATADKESAQTGKTDYQLLDEALKPMTHRFYILQKNPPERDRVNVVNFFLGADGRDIRLEVALQHCPSLVADYEQVLWKEDGSGVRKSRDSADAYYARTHSADGVGYLLWAREAGVIASAASDKRKLRQKIPVPYYGFAGR